MPTNNAIDLNSQGSVYYNGTGTFSGIDASTSGFVLTSNGTGVAPSFQAAAAAGKFYLGNIFTNSGNPADSTTYYFERGTAFTARTISTVPLQRIYFTKAATITTAYGVVTVGGTLASAGSSTVFIRKNNTSNTNITTSLAMTSSSNTFNNTGLSISMSAGDYVIIGLTTPSWATNPTLVKISVTISE